MLTRRFILATVAAGIALCPTVGFAQDSMELRFLTAWDDRVDGTVVVAEQYAENVNEASEGRLTFRFSGPEVIPPNQQFEPVSRGVFDLNFTTPVYFLGTTGVPSAFFALPPDAELWRENGYWDFADAELQRFNQKLIAFVPGNGKRDFYQLVLREPVDEGDKPLAGRKIRGNSYYEPLVAAMGGSLVNLPAGEMYSALEKGIVDGAAFPIAGMQRLGMHEVTGYMMRPRFGTSPHLISMNLDKFNSLSESDQELLLAEGETIEKTAPEKWAVLADEAIAELTSLGMEESEIPPEIFEPARDGLVDGSWQLAIEGNPQTAVRVEELREMARQHGDAE